MLAKSIFRGKVYPNGEFTLGKLPPVPAARKLKTPEHDPYEIGIDGCDAWGSSFAPPPGMAPVRSHQRHPKKTDCPGGESSLDLTYPVINHRPSQRARRGSSGMTSYAKRMLRNGIDYLEKTYGVPNLSFLTLTVPNLTREHLDDLARAFDNSRKQLLQSLRRLLQRAGLPSHVAGCVELQTKRLETRSEVAYHLHLVFVGKRKGSGWGIRPEEIRRAWKTACEHAIKNDLSYAQWNGTVDIHRIRSSVTRYLSKYLSKHRDNVLLARECLCNLYIPGTWNIMDHALRNIIRNGISIVSGCYAEWLWERCCEWKRERGSEWIKWCYRIETAKEETNVPIIAYVGQLQSGISIGTA